VGPGGGGVYALLIASESVLRNVWACKEALECMSVLDLRRHPAELVGLGRGGRHAA
jgi:hypothetical protein